MLNKIKRSETEKNLTNKFMYGIDSHIFFKCGKWSDGIDSLHKFLKFFRPNLTFTYKMQLLEIAFYGIMLLKNQKLLLPDYTAQVLDVRDDLDDIYGNLSPDCPTLERKKSSYKGNIKEVGSFYYDDDLKESYKQDDDEEEEHEYRQIMVREYDGSLPIEKSN